MSNWRDQPATEKQLRYLDQFNVKREKNLTKGLASDIIKAIVKVQREEYDVPEDMEYHIDPLWDFGDRD